MTNPIYGALIYGAPPLLFLATLPLLWTLLSVPIIVFLLPLLLAAVVYKLRHSTKPKTKGIESYNALVVGAGFSGLCVGAKLKKKGVPFSILEAASDVGGTWQHNSYPGAACDVWTTLYQFSFFQNPNWSRWVSNFRQKDIRGAKSFSGLSLQQRKSKSTWSHSAITSIFTLTSRWSIIIALEQLATNIS